MLFRPCAAPVRWTKSNVPPASTIAEIEVPGTWDGRECSYRAACTFMHTWSTNINTMPCLLDHSQHFSMARSDLASVQMAQNYAVQVCWIDVIVDECRL